MRNGRQRRGVSVIEHVLILALLVSCVVMCAEFITPLSDSMHEAANGMAGAAPRQTASSSKSDRSRTRAATEAQPVARLRGPRYAALLYSLAATALIVSMLRARRSATPASESLEVDQDERQKKIAIQKNMFIKRQQLLKVMCNDTNRLLYRGLTAGQVMSESIVSVLPTATAEEVRKTIAERGFHHMMVCDEQGRLKGIISDRDLKNVAAATAEELMTPEPVIIDRNSPIDPAITLMIHRRISALPVTFEKKLCGVLTTTDLIMTLQCTLHLLEEIANQLHDTSEAPSSESSDSSG